MVVSPEMRAELVSLDFDVQPEFLQSKKPIDMGGNFTTWSWSVKSSNAIGIQILYLKVYLGDAEEPIWIHRMQVGVQYPTTTTPTNIPTDTPLPPSATPLSAMSLTPIPIIQTPVFILGSGVLIALISFAGTITAAFISRSARKQESQNGKIEEDVKELKELLAEIGKDKRSKRK